jgi:23S rRNA (uracil1939-C5)-methyltransferase
VTAETFTITLEKLTYGGEALGRLPDGRAVFVPFALPGERVRLQPIEQKRGFARAELLEVLEPSRERIAPRCKHFGLCGGCHYQHMPYEAQLAAKRDILRDQLERIGKIEDPPVREAIPSPQTWNYRNNVQFHLTTKGELGYIGAGPASARILPISECHLPEDPIGVLWPQLDFKPEAGIQRFSLRLGTGDDLMLVLESDDLIPPESQVEAGISVVHLSGEEAVVLAGRDHLVMRVLDRNFHLSAASFFQVNTPMAGKMVGYLLDNLSLPAEIILDVYCGVGLFSAFLAPACQRLIGIEASPSACDDFVVNLNEFDHVALYQASAEEVLPYLEMKPEVILVDPPRAGLDKHVLDAILAMRPGTLGYVSCDPSTLARDAKRLAEGGYRLKQVTPFDLFPQTYHIESISIFTAGF